MYELFTTSAIGAEGTNTTVRSEQHQQSRATVSFVLVAPESETLSAGLLQEFQVTSLVSALDLHQYVERSAQKVQAVGGQLHMMAALFLDDRCIFCGIRGEVTLKRGEKAGKILRASDTVSVIEGRWQPSDIFLLTLADQPELEDQLNNLLLLPLSAEVFRSEVQQMFDRNTALHPALVTRLHFGEGETQSVQVTSTSAGVETVQPTSPKSANPNAFLTSLKNKIFGGVALLRHLPQMMKYWQQRMLSKDIYVRQQDPKKILRIVLPIVALVVVLGGAGLIWNSRRVEQVKAAEAVIAPLDARLAEIKTKVNDDPLDSRKQTEEVIVQLEQAIQQQKEKKIFVAQLEKKLNETRTFYDSISGMEEFAVLPTFFDLRFVESNFLAHRVAIAGENLFFLDQEEKKVIALNIPKKQSTPLPVGELSKLVDLVPSARNLFLLSAGIYQLPLAGTQTATQIRVDEEPLQNAQFIRLFNSNIYILNKEKRNIYRYPLGENNALSDSVGWVRSDQSLPYEELNSFVIDSDIWLTTRTGEIIKMRTGRRVDFTVTGLKDPFTSPLILYTTEESPNIYILEPDQKRLVVLTKEGEFLREVKSSTLASTTGLVVNEELKKAFVVSGALVFEIGL